MPSSTTIKQLVLDLQDRKSQIARKFDSCNDKCQSDSAYRTKILNLINSWNPNAQPPHPLPAELVTEIGLTLKEVAHIEDWPQRAVVRNEIVGALTPDSPLDMRFFWDLLKDPTAAQSESDIDSTGTPIKITFLTRRNQVTKSGLTYGEVKLGT